MHSCVRAPLSPPPTREAIPPAAPMILAGLLAGLVLLSSAQLVVCVLRLGSSFAELGPVLAVRIAQALPLDV